MLIKRKYSILFIVISLSLILACKNKEKNLEPLAKISLLSENPTVDMWVQLDGSESKDPEGAQLSFYWKIVESPVGSSVDFVDNTVAKPYFKPDLPGTYVVVLKVFDGFLWSQPSQIEIDVKDKNHPPVADAGKDLIISLDNAISGIYLDASRSSDPDGDDLTYTWDLVQKPDQSAVEFSNVEGVQVTFTPDLIGTYVLQLTVTDPQNASDTDEIKIDVISGNAPPIADAGMDTLATVGQETTLDGSKSFDPNGDAIFFSWFLIQKPSSSSISLSGTNDQTLSFVPDVEGQYIFELVVSDIKGASSSDRVTVTAISGNATPVADAGQDRIIEVGNEVVLDGGSSYDPNGDSLSYSWHFVTKPSNSAVTLQDTTSSLIKFTPDVEGIYTLELIVSDPYGATSSDRTTITAVYGNASPVADAGRDVTIKLGESVTLDGSGSYDPNGDPIVFSWHIVNKPQDSSLSVDSSTNSATLLVTPDVVGSYVFELVVTDQEGLSSSDRVTLTVVYGNAAPVADAGGDRVVNVGESVTLDGSGSYDPNGDNLNFSWHLVEKPTESAVSTIDSNSITYSFTPDVVGSYVVILVVSDQNGATDSDRVTITTVSGNASPVADAGPDRVIDVNSSVTLDGSGSYDPNGDTLTFNWYLISKPSGSSISLQNTTSQTVSFTPDIEGDYEIELIVTDDKGASDSDIVRVTAVLGNTPPVAIITVQDNRLVGYKDDTFNLSGSSSYDPNGDVLIYSWMWISRPSGSQAQLNINNDAASFKADARGTYTIGLVVSDGQLQSDLETVSIEVINRPPVANAGNNLDIDVGDIVKLDGSGSNDPDNDTLGYHWTIESAPSLSMATITSADSKYAWLKDITQPGTYVIRLTVYDYFGDRSWDEITVVANSPMTMSYNQQLFSGSNNKSIASPSVLFDSDANIYRMWYTEIDQNNNTSSIWYADSSDGKTWQNFQQVTFNSNCNSWWENNYCSQPSVIFDKQAGVYKMWYAGGRWEGNNFMWYIGYATSTDGKSWDVQNNKEPVLSPSGGGDDKWAVAHPAVIKIGDVYYMLYAGSKQKVNIPDTYVPDWQWRILLAYSIDGIIWSRLGTVINNGDGGVYTERAVSSPWISYNGNILKVFYAGQDNNDNWSILSASTSDLLNYQFSTLIIPSSNNGSTWQVDPSVIYSNTGNYKLWYISFDSTGNSSLNLANHP